MAFFLVVGASLGSSVFPALVAFLFLWYQLYYRINIGQSQYQDSRRSGRAIICAEYQIYRTFAYTPGIGNEGGMCWECSWCGVSPPLRSGKDSPTNGINNFFSGICGFLKHNLGYNFIKNADIQGFCSWASLGRDGFLHCIIVQFPGAEMAFIWLSGPIVLIPGLVPGAWAKIALRALFWPLRCVSDSRGQS